MDQTETEGSSPVKQLALALTLFMLAGCAPDAEGQQLSQEQASTRRYCAGCHNRKVKMGGLSLDTHDVADAGIAEARADAVDQHALADLQRRHHRLARDPVRLDQERLDAQGKAEGNRHDHDQLEQGARR